MLHTLPKLSFSLTDLQPYMSEETLQYHFYKHHDTYVNNLNKLIENTPYANQNLEFILTNASGPMFNNAAQHWNHSFFWQSLTPQKLFLPPDEKLSKGIDAAFGSLTTFKEKFSMAALSLFGSGWVWLVTDSTLKLAIFSSSNADNPLKHNLIPLLTLDVWEHAYYIDYRNLRSKYVENLWKIVNWSFVNHNYSQLL